MTTCLRTPKNRLHNPMTGGYISRAAAKSAVGIGTPVITRAPHRAYRGFFVGEARPHLRIMVGRAGQPQGWPGSLVAGSSNPVRLTTPSLEPLVGELSKPTREDAPSWQPSIVTSRVPARSKSIAKPKSTADCSAPSASRKSCLSTCCTPRHHRCFLRTRQRCSAIWLMICATYSSSVAPNLNINPADKTLTLRLRDCGVAVLTRRIPYV